MKFKNAAGEVISLAEIASQASDPYEYQVFIGSDSQVYKKKKSIIYATCVVLYKKGKGGRVFVAKESQPFGIALRERLTNESWRSLRVAFSMSELLQPGVEVIIHVDVNKDLKYKSGNYHQALVSLITGQGYKCIIKPNAWAAQSVADHFTKR